MPVANGLSFFGTESTYGACSNARNSESDPLSNFTLECRLDET
jgi:hypothetical protein